MRYIDFNVGSYEEKREDQYNFGFNRKPGLVQLRGPTVSYIEYM